MSESKELQLATSNKFYDSEANFYEDANGEMWMTIQQIAKCLEYQSRRGIDKLRKNNPELDTEEFSIDHPGWFMNGRTYPTRLFNEDGIYEICMLSEKTKAKEFRRWVRGILKNIRKGELQIVHADTLAPVLEIKEQINSLFGIIQNQTNHIEKLEVKLESQFDKIKNIQKSTSRTETMIRPLVPNSKPYSTWKSSTSKNLNRLADEIDEEGKYILRNIYIKMKEDFDIDVNLYSARYAADHPEESPLNGLDTVDYYNELHEPFESVLNNYKKLFLIAA